MIARLACVACLAACGGQQVPALGDPGQLPFSAYMVCDFDAPVEAGIALSCAGTFAEPVCTTTSGIGAQCSFGVNTEVPMLGTVGAASSLSAGVGDAGWAATVKACVVAGPWESCVVDVQAEGP